MNFCTLFDSSYLVKALCMYDSLKRVTTDFHLYVFAFDYKTNFILNELQLENLTIISLSEFEDNDLLSVKSSRTIGEYCWTCTPSSIFYCIQRFDLQSCTYIDADLYFYDNPKVLIDEMGDKDVLITPHRYTPEFDQSAQSGRYCVQFMTFKNTLNGLKVLDWWKRECLKWCYARLEDGKFGDQMYLDDWTTRFSGIHELEHLGGGVAPWNMQQYLFSKRGSKFIGTELLSGRTFNLIFFHFHAMETYKLGIVGEYYFDLYPMPSNTRKLIYIPYFASLRNQFQVIRGIDKTKEGLIFQKIKITFWKIFRILKSFIIRKKIHLVLYKIWPR